MLSDVLVNSTAPTHKNRLPLLERKTWERHPSSAYKVIDNGVSETFRLVDQARQVRYFSRGSDHLH